MGGPHSGDYGCPADPGAGRLDLHFLKALPVTISVTGTLERPGTRYLRILEFLSMDGPMDVGSRLPKYFDLIGRVRHQAAGLNENTKRVDRRQAVARRQRNDLVAIENQRSIRR